MFICILSMLVGFAWVGTCGSNVVAFGVVEGQPDPVVTPPLEKTDQDRLYDRLDAFYSEVINDDHLVKYDLLKNGERHDELAAIVSAFGSLKIPEARSDKLAFLINAYNVNVIHQVIATGIPNKVIDVDGFFKERPITVAGRALTLDRLENELIRPMGDPRIHAALNCAAVSCPVLSKSAYRGKLIDAQLDEQCRIWINNPSKNRVDDRGQLHVSMIFNWFANDFVVEPYGGRIGFILQFAKEDSPLARAAGAIRRSGRPELAFLDYDWSLNAAPASTDDDHSR